MLILTRQAGESLKIDDNVTVTVLNVEGNQVKIGIDAPKEVDVHRQEIYLRIQREKTLADKFEKDIPLETRTKVTSQSEIQPKKSAFDQLRTASNSMREKRRVVFEEIIGEDSVKLANEVLIKSQKRIDNLSRNK